VLKYSKIKFYFAIWCGTLAAGVFAGIATAGERSQAGADLFCRQIMEAPIKGNRDVQVQLSERLVELEQALRVLGAAPEVRVQVYDKYIDTLEVLGRHQEAFVAFDRLLKGYSRVMSEMSRSSTDYNYDSIGVVVRDTEPELTHLWGIIEPELEHGRTLAVGRAELLNDLLKLLRDGNLRSTLLSWDIGALQIRLRDLDFTLVPAILLEQQPNSLSDNEDNDDSTEIRTPGMFLLVKDVLGRPIDDSFASDESQLIDMVEEHFQAFAIHRLHTIDPKAFGRLNEIFGEQAGSVARWIIKNLKYQLNLAARDELYWVLNGDLKVRVPVERLIREITDALRVASSKNWSLVDAPSSEALFSGELMPAALKELLLNYREYRRPIVRLKKMRKKSDQ